MKKEFKILFLILVIALISIIAFAGVYTKDVVSYKEVLPKYMLASELTGKRISFFKLSDEIEEKIYDKDGHEVESIPEGEDEADYRKEEVKLNSEESLTEDNYNTVKKIFEGRFKEIGVEDYLVRLNKETGEIAVEIKDDENTDTFLQYLLFKGDFAMTDSEDGTVLLGREDIDKASVVYGNTKTGEVTVYLDIKFNSEGAKKLEEVSQKYIKVENEEDTQKTVTLTIEGSEIMTTYFGEVMKNGDLTISMGSGTDNETVYNYARQAGILAMIINNGEMPLTYTISNSEFIASELSGNTIYIIIAILSFIVLAIIIYMIVKFKLDGLYAGLSFIFAIALLLLLLRYTKTAISLGGFAALTIIITVETYFVLSILKSLKKDSSIDNTKSVTKKIYIKKLDVIITLLITAVVFTFMKEVKIYSIGMTLFYGIISLAITNFVFLRTLLIENHK